MRDPFPFSSGSFHALNSIPVIHHARFDTVRGTIREIGPVLQNGGIAFVSVPAVIDTEDEAGEIEPGTYVPTSGWGTGLPHHIFSPAAFPSEFEDFDVLDLSVRGDCWIISILAQKR
jgi:hypothetical protein